jgi:Kef-type K+ transport system membrane component KefB
LSISDFASILAPLKAAFATPVAVTALLFFLALFLAEAAVRMLRAPRIAALVLAGALLGALRRGSETVAIMPLPNLLLEALAMVLLFEVGQRVPLGWLRRNPWLLATSMGECAFAFAAIYTVLVLGFAVSSVDSALVAVICMAASPIVVMSVSKDLRTRGQVSERALLLSTLSSVYAVLLLQLFVAGYRAAAGVELASVMQPIWQLAGSFLLGVIAAAALRLYAVVTRARGALLTIGIICCCVLLYAYALPLGLSPILAALFFGLIVRGTDRTHHVLSHQTSETGAVLTLAYFILVGASLSWIESWALLGVAAAAATARLLAKVVANTAIAPLAGLSFAKGALVGVALAPLSSLALTLIASVALQPELRRAAEVSAAVVLFMAILGPVLTELALRRAGEPTSGTAR